MTERRELPRVLGLTDIVFLGISSIIGSGIFLLPGEAAGAMGPAALVALLLAGLLCVLIALCFAEVSSRFTGTGGAYLYAREAFGDFAGFSVGWMGWWVQVIAWAALGNAFALALEPLIGEVPTWFHEAVAVGSIAVLSAVNYGGARLGASLTNAFTIAKLIPLVLFIVVGVLYIDGGRFTPFAPHGYASTADTTLLLLWAFVGFEDVVVPAGEVKRPGRTIPLAMIIVMAAVTVVYVLVFVVSVGTYDALPGSTAPVAEAAAEFLGEAGGTLVAAGIAVSVFGTMCVSAIVVPRRAFALAERGQAPPILAEVHANRGTPAVAILVTAVFSIGLALSGSFAELAVISVLGRFFQYLPTCIGVLVLRRRDAAAGVAHEGFRLPFGPLIPIAATLLCLGLLAVSDPTKLVWGSVAFFLGIPFYSVYGRASR